MFFTSISASVGGGFTRGLLIGYALKKVIKIIAVILGLFMAGLAYLLFSYQNLQVRVELKKMDSIFF